MNETITLIGKDVLKMSIDPAQQSDKNGKPYYRARYAGKVFTVGEDVFEAYTKGELAEITISPNEYQRENPEIAGEMMTMNGWAYSGHATYEQITGIETKQGELALGRKRFDVAARKLDVEVLKLEKEALAVDVKLTTEQVNKLADAV